MFISVLDLYKIGIGPSSSHTMGPLVAAAKFREKIILFLEKKSEPVKARVSVQLFGSLAWTGRGHQSDRAVLLGLHGFTNQRAAEQSIEEGWEETLMGLMEKTSLEFSELGTHQYPEHEILFNLKEDLRFRHKVQKRKHPNQMLFEMSVSDHREPELSMMIYSIGGGFVLEETDFETVKAPIKLKKRKDHPFPFSTTLQMLEHCLRENRSIAEIKRSNEHCHHAPEHLSERLQAIWKSMEACLRSGLGSRSEILPGPLGIKRRAAHLYQSMLQEGSQETTDLLCTYAMAVNEENACGHLVVTAPTNGAAGVVPAVLKLLVDKALEKGETQEQVDKKIEDFLLTAGAIGALVKQNSSISGAEVGCQGEVGTASAMAAAGLCAWKGGSPKQVENAAEIALEHHLGLTCDPVKALVQVPCIERNGFGAVKAWTAAHLALRGNGEHYMPLDNCIKAMKETGQAMSEKFKETSLGGLAVNATEC